jgi:hypothetical protein
MSDPLDPARGVILATVFSAAIWAEIIIAFMHL